MRVLVLNQDYTPLAFIDWQKAISLIYSGKAEVLKNTNEVIRSVNETIFKPLAIRLLKMVRSIFKTKVPYSKANILMRDGFKCQYCGSNENLTIDHIIPRAKGGKSTWENCISACKTCNNKKGDKLSSEIKMYPKSKPYQPTISEFVQMKLKKHGLEKMMQDIFS